MKCYYLIYILTLLSGWSHAQISGRVLQSPTSVGVSECIVRAYDEHHLLATTRTTTTGEYRLSVPKDKPVRLEVELPIPTLGNAPIWYPALRSSLSRIVSSPAQNVNFQVHRPASMTASSFSKVAAVLYLNGNQQGEEAQQYGGVVANLVESNEKASPQVIATAAQVGALWGLAYDPTHQRMYSAAFAKRHVGFGPAGAGGIYVSSLSSAASPTTKVLVNLSELGIPTAPQTLTRDLTKGLQSVSKDSALFGLVGQISLGGIALSEDTRTLYVVNLFDRHLYGLQLSAKEPGRVSGFIRYPLPNLQLKGGQVRPFAVKIHAGQVWVGAVCDASISQKQEDLMALIYVLEAGKKGLKEVVQLPLNYARNQNDQWHPWTSEFSKAIRSEHPSVPSYPQPILSALEFDADGNLILGLMDRFGHQSGTNQPAPNGYGLYTGLASGDLLRVAFDAPKSSPKFSRLGKYYQVEVNAQAGQLRTEGTNNGQGPSGGEFYYQDSFRWQTREIHAETGAGGLALWSDGSREYVLHATHEPTEEFNTSGVSVVDNQTGKAVGAMALYRNQQMGYFSKVNGIGDIELINEALPISVGHKIWWDANENGVLDPSEMPLSGLTIELFQGTELVGSTQTDSQGEYWFDYQNVRGGLAPFTAYEIRISTTQGSYKNLKVTSAKSSIIPTSSEIRYVFHTGKPGANSDTLSLGFRCQPSQTITTQTVVNHGKATILLSGYQSTDRFTWYLQGEGNTGTGQRIPSTGVVWSGPISSEPLSYHLKIHDLRGCTTERKGLIAKSLVPDADSNDALIVYPNPVDRVATVRLKTVDSGIPLLKVIDASGKVLYEQTMQSEKGEFVSTLRADSFGSGLLIIKVQTPQSVFSKGVIKE